MFSLDSYLCGSFWLLEQVEVSEVIRAVFVHHSTHTKKADLKPHTPLPPQIFTLWIFLRMLDTLPLLKALISAYFMTPYCCHFDFANVGIVCLTHYI